MKLHTQVATERDSMSEALDFLFAIYLLMSSRPNWF
jgi:hypothetical protein